MAWRRTRRQGKEPGAGLEKEAVEMSRKWAGEGRAMRKHQSREAKDHVR